MSRNACLLWSRSRSCSLSWILRLRCPLVQREEQLLLLAQIPSIVPIREEIAPPQTQPQEPLVQNPATHAQIGRVILRVHIHAPNRRVRHPHQPLILGNAQLVEQSPHLRLTSLSDADHQLHAHHGEQLQRQALGEFLDPLHPFLELFLVRVLHPLDHLHPNLLDLLLGQLLAQLVPHPRRSPRENHRKQLRFPLEPPHLAGLHDRLLVLANHREPQPSEVLIEPFSEVHVHPMVQNHQLRLLRPGDASNHQIPGVWIHVQLVEPEDHIAERLHADPTDLRLVEAFALQRGHVVDFGAVDVLHHHDSLRAELQIRLRNVHRGRFREESAAVAKILRLAAEVELALDRRADFGNDPLR